MSSEDLPPMPAAPPPAAREPSAPTPAPLPPLPASGELVDSVPGAPGAAPAEPAVSGHGGLILPSDLPTWAPPQGADQADGSPGGPAPEVAEGESDAGDTIPVATFLSQLAEAHRAQAEQAQAERAQAQEEQVPVQPVQPSAGVAGDPVAATEGAMDHPVIPLIESPDAAPRPHVVTPPVEADQPEWDQPEWATATQRGWSAAAGPVGFAGPGAISPPPGMPPPRPGMPSPPATTGGAHAGAPTGGRGKLLALIGGLVVLAALVIGGFLIHSSSSKKTPIAAPSPSAVISPSPAPTTAPTTAASPSPAAPSPTVAVNLARQQAAMLQKTVVAPLKALVTADLRVTNASDHCLRLAPNAASFKARTAKRSSLLSKLRKLDVTAMPDQQTWKGLLEAVQLKNIAAEQQLAAYSKALEAGCDPSTATQNPHYQAALAELKASGALQKKFVASYNPVAKRYNIPMQGAANL